MRTKHAQGDEPLDYRLTVRLSRDDHAKLLELQRKLHIPTPGAAMRSLIRLHYVASQPRWQKGSR
jgi:hypothetical protein